MTKKVLLIMLADKYYKNAVDYNSLKWIGFKIICML